MRLSDLCEIQSGYTARTGLEPSAVGGTLAIQLRDIAADGVIDPDRLMRVSPAGPVDRYLVAPGDVVFRSRGERNTAHAIDESFTEPAIAVLPLMVLRPHGQRVTAPYLAWAINQPAVQRQIDAGARGTNIRMTPKSSLEELDLDVPDLPTQHLIVEIDRLAERERSLALQLASTRRWITSVMLNDRARSAARGLATKEPLR